MTAPVLPPLSSLDKMRFWLTETFVGFNVRSNIKLDDLMALRELGVEVVRVGAVSSSERTPSPDLCYLLDAQGGVRGEGLDTLALAVRQFRDHGFKLVLTLARSLATPALWSALARTLAVFDNVIGYDVINEPYECNTVRQTEGGAANFKELFKAVRAQDQSTPVVLEPLEWASHDHGAVQRTQCWRKSSSGCSAHVLAFSPDVTKNQRWKILISRKGSRIQR